MAHKVMVPNSVLSINGPPLYQSYPGGGRLNPLPPDKILDGRGLYSGTAGVIGYKDKPLGKRVETECDYEGQRKTTIFEVNEEQAGLIDTAVLCDHVFASDGTPLIPLSNAKSGEPIRTHEEMLAASEVIVKFNSNTYLYQTQNRNGGLFEKVGGVIIKGYISTPAALGLVARLHCYSDTLESYFYAFFLANWPSRALEVAVEAAESRTLKSEQSA